MRHFAVLGWVVVAVLAGRPAEALQPRPADSAMAARWVGSHLGSETGAQSEPFSFIYGGERSTTILPRWNCERRTRKLDDYRTEYTLTYTDPATRMVVQCVAVVYADFPAVEYVLHFRNDGPSDTPILEDVQALDARFDLGSGDGEPRLLYSLGSHERPSDFAPQEQALDEPVHLSPYGGRSSDGVLPFFHVAQTGGVIIGVGWTGQWAATFAHAEDGQVSVQAGMERTHLLLHPGEAIRTPGILLLFRAGGEPSDGQNVLRSLLLKHYTPMPHGRPVVPPVAASPHGVIGFSDTSEANMVQVIERLAEHRFPVDTFWIDAGWHGEDRNWARCVGSWEPNAERFPRGMKPVADAAHAHGLRFLLWFEPERVMPDTWLYTHHRDWLLRPADLPPELQYQDKDGFHLLDLGHPEALAWAKSTFSRMIGETGIDIYRHDFNMTPLHYWRNGEAADRQGMNEIRHVTGLYDYFDTLRREHPGLLLDNCASGGRRIDFEIMRRALTLFRSDLCWDPTAEQSMTYGLAPWMPVTGVGAISTSPYGFRSGLGSHLSLALDYLNSPDTWTHGAAAIGQYQAIRRYFTADFYTLTPYSLEKDRWIAWQYHDAGSQEGLVQAFRRENAPDEGLVLKLRGLAPGLVYDLDDQDAGPLGERSGRALMEEGLRIRSTAPGATLLHYAPHR